MGTPFASLLAGLALVLAARPAPAQAPPSQAPTCLTVEYTEVSERQIDKDGPGPEPATTEMGEAKLVATLGPRRLALQSGDTLRTWLFEAGVARTIDRTAGTYDEVSLLHEVAFVQIEMRNRLRMKNVLQSAEIGIADEWSPFDLSVLFCWPAEGDEVTLDRVDENGEVRFSRAGQVVANWRLAETALDADQRAMFSRLLQRRTHLHPQALAALVAAGRLPSELVFRWRSPGVRATTTWRLTGASTDGAWPGSIEGLRRTFGDGPLGRIARMVCEPGTAGVPEKLSAERFAALAEAAGKERRFGDAVMLLLESSLTTGEEVPQLRALAASSEAKEQMRVFTRPIAVANTDPDKALVLFGELDRSTLSRPAFVDVFRVNALRQKGKLDEARDLMLATLEASPWITMAYKDLGDLLLAGFATAPAWTAWELGRRIAPRHGCWAEVEAYEKKLRRDFADRL